jgi:hypothetical protein
MAKLNAHPAFCKEACKDILIWEMCKAQRQQPSKRDLSSAPSLGHAKKVWLVDMDWRSCEAKKHELATVMCHVLFCRTHPVMQAMQWVLAQHPMLISLILPYFCSSNCLICPKNARLPANAGSQQWWHIVVAYNDHKGSPPFYYC